MVTPEEYDAVASIIDTALAAYLICNPMVRAGSVTALTLIRWTRQQYETAKARQLRAEAGLGPFKD